MSHIAFEKHQDCKKILSGESRDIVTLPVIYSAPDNWRDDVAGALKQSCPALNQTVGLDYYLDQWQAIQGKPLDEARFETLCCARWVGSPIQFIPPNFWQACATPIKESDLHGCEAIVGLDYGASFDLTCISIIVKKDGLFYILPRFFLPRKLAQKRSDADNVPYITWANNPETTGLYLTDGDVVDSAALVDRMKYEGSLFDIKEVRYDRTRLEGFRQLLEREGFDLVEVPQTINSMSPAFSLFERLVREKKIRHADNPLANWNLNNCVPKRDRHDRLMVEKSGPQNKIDFVDASCIALTYWLGDTDPLQPPPGQQWATMF